MAIAPLGPTPREIQRYLNGLAKPLGSLGRLESLATRLCTVQATLKPWTKPRLLVIFAGDHGVVAEGVSAWPAAVTELLIDNILAGGAASCALARQTNAFLRVVDVGSLAQPRPQDDGYRFARIAPATANLAREPAMTVEQFRAARQVGREEAKRAAGQGMIVVAAGELGVGNTTSAACLGSLLCDTAPARMAGPGAGADETIIARKVEAMEQGLRRARPLLQSHPTAAIASVCGFEIAALAGFYEAAAQGRLTIVLDGFTATAAALVAETLWPGTRHQMIAAHRSAEPGHGRMLKQLDLDPLLEWDLRLGEGTGALLALPMLDAAAAMIKEMATFISADLPSR